MEYQVLYIGTYEGGDSCHPRHCRVGQETGSTPSTVFDGGSWRLEAL